MIQKINMLLRSIMAGICIALGGAAFLHFEEKNPIVGAVLFAFGLLTILYYKMPLYTGKAGFVASLKDVGELFIVLIGNVIGCFAIAQLLPSTYDGADIVFNRIEVGYGQCFCCAILCGIIMTLIVHAGRSGNYILTIFGIPLFILCGYYHSIADAFYMFAVRDDFDLFYDYFIPFWFIIVLGNFIGCNIPRLLLGNKILRILKYNKDNNDNN